MSIEIEGIDISLLYDLHFDRVYKFFYFKVLSKEIAEDLTSETFMSFANALNKKKEILEPEKYLYGIAKHVFIKYLKAKYKQPLPFSAFPGDFEEYMQNFVMQNEATDLWEDKIKPHLEKLPEKQQVVMKLRLLEKLTLGEVADRLGKNMNYVKTTQKRGIKTLKKIIALH